MPSRRINPLASSFTKEEAEADLGSQDSWSETESYHSSEFDDFIDDEGVEEGEIPLSDSEWLPFNDEMKPFLRRYRNVLSSLWNNLVDEGRRLMGHGFLQDAVFEEFVIFVYEHMRVV